MLDTIDVFLWMLATRYFNPLRILDADLELLVDLHEPLQELISAFEIPIAVDDGPLARK